MGRYYWSKKEEADGLNKIKLWFLKKHGYFKDWGNSGTITWTHGFSGHKSSVGVQTLVHGQDQYLRIHYTKTDREDNKKDFDYKIPLVTTPCYFGGKRYWFICPWYTNGVYCGRRVGVLYLGGDYFACRHCYDLTYESRNESRNNHLFPLFSVLGGYKKAEDLEMEMKRRYYAGKPTKKHMKLMKIQGNIFRYGMIAKESGLLDKE